MILRLFEQDVQISGTKTGSLVSAGHDIGGVFFSWLLHFLDKQQKVLYRDVLMLRSHGCEGAATRHRGEIKTQKSIVNHQIYSKSGQS